MESTTVKLYSLNYGNVRTFFFKAYNSFQGKAVIDKEVICESNI